MPGRARLLVTSCAFPAYGQPAPRGLSTAEVRDWPVSVSGTGGLLDRVWKLRDSVRGWDAFYVALAELFDATPLTMDERLACAHRPTCRI